MDWYARTKLSSFQQERGPFWFTVNESGGMSRFRLIGVDLPAAKSGIGADSGGSDSICPMKAHNVDNSLVASFYYASKTIHGWSILY